MPRWNASELEVLRALYPTRSNLEIALELQRSVKSVVSKAHHLGLKKEIERLREMGRENVRLRYNGRE
jgi:DNA-binding NarL/FixJ family response regulator